jgi:hypothetical protein
MTDAAHSIFVCCLCPLACQCNGHSTCPANSSVCIQPCANLTQGPHCEHCVLGYYGNPVNGGKCIRKYDDFLINFSNNVSLYSVVLKLH